MKWKTMAVGLLSLLTITSCAHPVERALQIQSQRRTESLYQMGRISQGACDDVGQFIPSQLHGGMLEASGSPIR
jgi:hypothetical protein